MSVLARVRAVVIAELERHTTIIETVGLRSVTVTVKLKSNGDPRAVLFYPEIEWECGEIRPK